uniref:Histone acetyltransferase n=1 Tax=Arcella intermedia TaxID=1963864 RepID=A0A6B2L4T9_9EUKA
MPQPIVLGDVEPGEIVGEWQGPQIKMRDGIARGQEEEGILRFIPVWNDGNSKSLLMLLRLKHLITLQLPNMPKEYVTRLVFSHSHRSIVGLKMIGDEEHLIAGITFNCYDNPDKHPDRARFIEVVFLAVRTDQQVHGYGSRLMNQLKTWSQKNDYLHLLTYADNSAIGYFQRQGFTEEIEMKKNEWDIGFLKSYQDATLMYCGIDPHINYLDISSSLRKQRLAFLEAIKKVSNQHYIYSGVKHFKKGTFPIDLEKLKGLKDAGWDATKFKELLSAKSQREIFKKNEQLLDAIKEDKECSWPFRAPVVELHPAAAEKYLSTVKDPIDLRTIEEKLRAGFYITHEMMLADLRRMVINCQEFNPRSSEFWELAEQVNVKYLRDSITEVNE